MRRVNVTELRNNLPGYVGRVKKGEEILVTSRGKAVARLLPILDHRQKARERLAQLRIRCTIGDLISPVDEAWAVDHAGA